MLILDDSDRPYRIVQMNGFLLKNSLIIRFSKKTMFLCDILVIFYLK